MISTLCSGGVVGLGILFGDEDEEDTTIRPTGHTDGYGSAVNDLRVVFMLYDKNGFLKPQYDRSRERSVRMPA